MPQENNADNCCNFRDTEPEPLIYDQPRATMASSIINMPQEQSLGNPFPRQQCQGSMSPAINSCWPQSLLIFLGVACIYTGALWNAGKMFGNVGIYKSWLP